MSFIFGAVLGGAFGWAIVARYYRSEIAMCRASLNFVAEAEYKHGLRDAEHAHEQNLLTTPLAESQYLTSEAQQPLTQEILTMAA
jgi:hypothetical protein